MDKSILNMEKFLLIMILILCFSCIINSKKGFKVKFKNLECKANYSWFAKNDSCRIKACSRTLQTIEMYAYAIKPLRELRVAVEILKRYNGWKPWVLGKVSISLCDLLDKRKFHPLYKMVKPTLNKYTNFNHSCPYQGDIIAKNLSLDVVDYGTMIMPSGYYRYDILYYEENTTLIGYVKFYFDIIEYD